MKTKVKAKAPIKLRHEFVEFMPDKIENGVLYVSMPYATATHKCVCGCGNYVVTPLTPTDWQMSFDGEAISLKPSIGNWSFPCRSHYWIRNNTAVWAGRWTDEEIQAGREWDRQAKDEYYDGKIEKKETEPKIEGWLGRLKRKSKSKK